MIPYDDLVVALATWRARQGLAVAQPAGAAPAPPPRAAAPAPAAPQRTGRVVPPSAPQRTAAPPPAQVSSELHDFDESDGALIEEFHDEGGLAAVDAGEATAIGGAPEPPAESLLVPRRGKRPPDR